MILRDAALTLALGAGWIALAPARRVTRAVALWQALATIAVVATHLRGRVPWELDVRRPLYLASRARGEWLDRGVSLLLGAAFLSLAVCVLRWREGASSRALCAMGATTALFFAASAWMLR